MIQSTTCFHKPSMHAFYCEIPTGGINSISKTSKYCYTRSIQFSPDRTRYLCMQLLMIEGYLPRTLLRSRWSYTTPCGPGYFDIYIAFRLGVTEGICTSVCLCACECKEIQHIPSYTPRLTITTLTNRSQTCFTHLCCHQRYFS